MSRWNSESAQDYLARIDREHVDRAAAARRRREDFEAAHPVREDLHPLWLRLGSAIESLSRMRRQAADTGEPSPPLTLAAAEASEAAALAQMKAAAVAATADGQARGIRIPLTLPASGFYIVVTP